MIEKCKNEKLNNEDLQNNHWDSVNSLIRSRVCANMRKKMSVALVFIIYINLLFIPMNV